MTPSSDATTAPVGETASNFCRLHLDTAIEAAANPQGWRVGMSAAHQPFLNVLEDAYAWVDKRNTELPPDQQIGAAERSELVEQIFFQRFAITIREQSRARFPPGQQPETEVFKQIYAELIAELKQKIQAAGGAAIPPLSKASSSSAAPTSATEGSASTSSTGPSASTSATGSSASTSATGPSPNAYYKALDDIHATKADEIARLARILRTTQASREVGGAGGEA